MKAHETNSELMRRWTNRMLECHLSLGLLHRGKPDAKDQMLMAHEAELAAYVAVGALSAQEAEEWLERFARAARALAVCDEEVATQAVRARAEELVEDHLAALAAPAEARDRAALRRFCSALWALKRVGAISEETHHAYQVRARPKRQPRPQASRGPSRPSFEAAVLERVVAGPSVRLSAVRLICVELYRDCVTLRWHRLLTPEETAARDEFSRLPIVRERRLEQRRRWGADFELHDDRGTRYTLVARDSPRDHEWFRPRDDKPTPVWGYATFLPQPPPDATRLEAVNDSDRFVIALTDA